MATHAMIELSSFTWAVFICVSINNELTGLLAWAVCAELIDDDDCALVRLLEPPVNAIETELNRLLI